MRQLARSPQGLVGALLVGSLAATALLAPWLAPYGPLQQHPGLELRPPGGAFLLGTDELGRDLLSRIMFGARATFVVALIAVGMGTAIGGGTGLIAGYFGGRLDATLMRLYDMILTFPGILVGIAIVTVVGPGPTNVAFALAVGLAPAMARLIRASVLVERSREYVMAARSCGSPDRRIMWSHILPNSLTPLTVFVFLSLGFTVLSEAGLSFLGLGTQPPQPSWGAMLNTSRLYLREAPWYGICPGLALAALMYGLNNLADWIRDLLDPRRRSL